MHKALINTLILTALAPLSIPVMLAPSTAQQTIAQIAQRIDCSKATATPEIKYCSQLSYAAADKKLNQVYQQVTSGMKSEQKQILVTAQQNWIRFRDNNCNFETYTSRGGTGYEIFRNGCLERLTKQRTKDLQDYLSSPR